MKDKYFSIHDGMPTGPDVAVLRKRYAELKPGDRLTYESVAEVIGITHDSVRFRTVTNAWRKEMEDQGIVIICEAGKAFLIATPDQITGATSNALRHIGRTAKKQRKHLATVRPADDATRNVVEHQSRLMLAIEQDARKKRMNILPSLKPADPMPAIEPPKKALGIDC